MAENRKTASRTFPVVQNGEFCWCEEIEEDGEVEVGPPDDITTAMALAGMYYMENKESGVKYLVHPDDFTRSWKYV